MNSIETSCPNCSQTCSVKFHTVINVPVNSCIILDTAIEALEYPAGNIELCFCQHCGFIYNHAFDTNLVEYSDRYQDQQIYSTTFGSFQENLVNQLVERYDLNNKSIMEIGCGKGDFLKLLCSEGNNRGYAIDPVANTRYFADNSNANIQIYPEHYSPKHAGIDVDFICCRHTLEHIPDTADFISLLRTNLANKSAKLFFEVPNTQLIIDNYLFQDIYYEHCSYFTSHSLEYLFESNGFHIDSIETAYNDQYLLLYASTTSNNTGDLPTYSAQKITTEHIGNFSAMITERIQQWKSVIQNAQDQHEKIVIWGSGSKCTAFLSALNISSDYIHIVDINPLKRGKYGPGLDIAIESPELFDRDKIDRVIIMNGIYENEIRAKIAEYSQDPEIMLL